MSPRVAARARKLRATRCLAIFVRTTAGVRSITFSIHYGGRWRRELRVTCQLVISPGDDVCGFRFFPLLDFSLNWILINQMTVIANKESDQAEPRSRSADLKSLSRTDAGPAPASTTFRERAGAARGAPAAGRRLRSHVQGGMVASAAHRTEILNTAAPDPGGVMCVYAEVPMSGFVCQPFPSRRSP